LAASSLADPLSHTLSCSGPFCGRAGAFVVGQSPMDGPASARGKTLAGPCDLAALMGGASVAAMQLPRRLAVMITAATGSAHPGIRVLA